MTPSRPTCGPTSGSMAGAERLRPSGSPDTPSGASWNSDTWDVLCPAVLDAAGGSTEELEAATQELVVDLAPHGKPVRVDHTTTARGAYDALLTLSGGLSVGLLRHGPTLPTRTYATACGAWSDCTTTSVPWSVDTDRLRPGTRRATRSWAIH